MITSVQPEVFRLDETSRSSDHRGSRICPRMTISKGIRSILSSPGRASSSSSLLIVVVPLGASSRNPRARGADRALIKGKGEACCALRAGKICEASQELGVRSTLRVARARARDASDFIGSKNEKETRRHGDVIYTRQMSWRGTFYDRRRRVCLRGAGDQRIRDSARNFICAAAFSAYKHRY